jgi:hypothetical protein
MPIPGILVSAPEMGFGDLEARYLIADLLQIILNNYNLFFLLQHTYKTIKKIFIL